MPGLVPLTTVSVTPMDRWYGPKGLRPEDPENAVYVFTGAPGMKPLSEIAPTEEEISDGWFYHGKHLDMFWNFDENGNSYLDEKLKAAGVDNNRSCRTLDG